MKTSLIEGVPQDSGKEKGGKDKESAILHFISEALLVELIVNILCSSFVLWPVRFSGYSFVLDCSP